LPNPAAIRRFGHLRTRGDAVSVYQLAALLLAIIGPVLAIAGHLKAPTSLVLFALGLGSAYLPGLPPVGVDPDLPLNLFLPPLIYASAVRVSWLLLRFTLVPGVVLGAVLILANVTVVAFALKLFLLPGLSWVAAVFIGAVTSIFDTRLFHEAKGDLACRAPSPTR
jgi:CPA1 family monovalent cation:H+ antiporter